jgi:hypothetical protein
MGSRTVAVLKTYKGVKSDSEREDCDVPGTFAITWRPSSAASVKNVDNLLLGGDNFG